MSLFRTRFARRFSIGACALSALLALLPPSSYSQPANKVARVGVVFNYPPSNQFEPDLKNPAALALRSEMAKLGWIPGRNLEILWRSWEGDPSRAPGILRELLQRPVDVLVLFGNLTIGEARKQTGTVPIVMGASSDPVDAGLVSALARPGGNITGLTLDSGDEIFGKRLTLLRDLVPGLSRVAYITAGKDRASVRAIFRELGVTQIRYQVARAEEVDAALADAKRKHAGAALLDDSAAFSNPESQSLIHAYAEKHRIPVMHGWLNAAEGGGLIAYASEGVNIHRVADYVDRILKGANPGYLPIEQPANYRLYVNTKAAKAIGLTIPASVMTQADKIIE